MNWKQAMQAMIDGQKVRFIEWHDDRWVSADDCDSISSYTFRELHSMEWEVYKKPTNTHDDVIKIFNSSTNRAQQAMSNIFKEAIEDIEKLKIR